MNEQQHDTIDVIVINPESLAELREVMVALTQALTPLIEQMACLMKAIAEQPPIDLSVEALTLPILPIDGGTHPHNGRTP